jgi:hypothetical protein
VSAAPSEHLLRTFAAVPMDQRVLVAGDDALRHAAALLQLGFDVTACTHSAAAADACRAALDAWGTPAPPVFAMPLDDLAFADESFGWIVATDLDADADLSGLWRVLHEGGWIFAETGASAERLVRAFESAGFAVAEAAAPAENVARTRGIFRRVGSDTVG